MYVYVYVYVYLSYTVNYICCCVYINDTAYVAGFTRAPTRDAEGRGWRTRTRGVDTRHTTHVVGAGEKRGRRLACIYYYYVHIHIYINITQK